MRVFGPLQFQLAQTRDYEYMNMVWIKWGVMHLCHLQNSKLIKVPILFVSEVLIFVLNVDLMSWKEYAFHINCQRNDVSGTWSVVRATRHGSARQASRRIFWFPENWRNDQLLYWQKYAKWSTLGFNVCTQRCSLAQLAGSTEGRPRICRRQRHHEN